MNICVIIRMNTLPTESEEKEIMPENVRMLVCSAIIAPKELSYIPHKLLCQPQAKHKVCNGRPYVTLLLRQTCFSGLLGLEGLMIPPLILEIARYSAVGRQ